MFAVDHDRDIALGRALRDRTNADSRVAERAEDLGSDTMRTGHAIANHGEDAAARSDFDALNLPLTQFAVECLANDRFSATRFVLGNREADGMLGTALGNQDDGHAVIAQCAEQAMRSAWHADHAGAFEVHQRATVD